ncbi:hypothetical protein HPB47_009793 [Ixodes persulcatus]|uniref:Uncharacterized protein n=1 Tax=Ixodes persulcatus TaxID=34615 RepID=A0AC60P0U7_IXOPE|nr:hypothetical protein HPB47_009793 [Ixodes persulcatus]
MATPSGNPSSSPESWRDQTATQGLPKTPVSSPHSFVVMDGDEISPEDFHAPNSSWQDAIKKAYARRRVQSAAVQPRQNQPGTTGLAAKRTARGKKSPRLPKLPEDDVRVVLRLRGGILLKPGDCVTLQRCIQLAANVTGGMAARDTFRLNEQQNTLLISTPSPENATRYSRLTKYTYREKEWEVAAYVVPPENTQRGVIQGIPQEDSEQDILENLVHSRNPSVLHARRMGRSNSVLILFEGDRVPFWVRYGNVDFRCYIYKKKVEICTTCGSVGHRGDVCPNPTDRRCNACYALNPAPTHDCLPSCGICGKGHPTGDKKCKLLYKTPHILVKRKWDRLQQAAEERTPFQPTSIDFPPLPPVSRSRSRTPTKRQNPRMPSRSRSRSRQRGGGAQTVQWGAPPASESTRESKDKTANNSRNPDLSDLRRMVTQLRDENRRLLDRLERTEQECAKLRQQLQAGATLPTPDPEATSPPVKRKMATRSKSPAPEREEGSSAPTQRGSPVSPHNSTASGRYRLTRTTTMRKSKAYIVWQWNCRGYGKKRGHFQQHINALPAEDRPDVIALQEPRRLAKLSGYVTFGCDNSEKTQVTTLVKRNVPVILHDTGISTIDHLLIEIIAPKKADTRSFFSYKRALGLPDSTSNDRFAALGLHNTVDEIVEAQRLSQMERLTRSATGRHILRSLGIRYDSQTGPKCAVPTQVRTALLIQPIPKHMHPIHHEGRRSARVRALRSLLSKERGVYYVDAADYGTGKMVSAVIDAGGSLVASCSIDTTDPGTAEEVAIALALQTYKARFVVSDSQRAIRQFAKGRVSPQAARILRGFASATSPIKLIWTPAHSSLPGNEEAHSAARGLIGRAGLTLDPSTTSLAGREGLGHFPGRPRLLRGRSRSLPAGARRAGQGIDGDLATPADELLPEPFHAPQVVPGPLLPQVQALWSEGEPAAHAVGYPKISAVTSQDDWDDLLKASSQEVQEAVVRWAEDAAKIQGIEAAV